MRIRKQIGRTISKATPKPQLANGMRPAPGIRAGVDIGGTFTDLMLIDRTGEVTIGKVLTTPYDPSEGVEEVLTQTLSSIGCPVDTLDHLVHGTTLVTNAIIERKGARTALVTTAGFRDSIEIGREHRYELYDLNLEHPVPLVPRHLRFAVPERTLADGTCTTRLDEEYLTQLVRELDDAGIEGVAVCFLHSFANPESEERARSVIRSVAPEMRVSLSSEVVPEIGEFERASTTIANVYVQPLVDQYLKGLGHRLGALGFDGQLVLMLSSGGLATLDTCRRFPVRLLESGPAAGALAAAAVGEAMGADSLLSFDMGGTTAKLSVVDDGEPLVTHDFEVDRRYRFMKGSGLPVRVPVIEMIEIGAGGGSIARVDSLGLLKVGPDSAGADPGPACYGRGGTHPTVTDADLVLGYLDPDFFLGGTMRLDVAAAEESLTRHIGTPLGMSAAEAAWGIHKVVNEAMANAARVHVVERGKNPRALPIIAFGGAGPVHGHGVAELLGSPTVVIPYGAGAASALGMLVAPLAFDFVRSHYGKLDDLDWDEVNKLFEEMERTGTAMLAASGVADDRVRHTRSADVRYVGQGHQIRVPVPDGNLGQAHRQMLYERFDGVYRELYGRAGPPVGLEALTWRVVSRGPRPRSANTHRIPDRVGTAEALKGERYAYFSPPDDYVTTAVYDRYRLMPGFEVEGPAIVEERESTVIIGPGSLATVDERMNLIVAIGDQG